MIAEEGRGGYATWIEGTKGDAGGFVVASVQFPHGEQVTEFAVFIGFAGFEFFAVYHGDGGFESLFKAF